MEKAHIINFLNGKINELKSLSGFITDIESLRIIEARIGTLTDVLIHVESAPVPFEML